jgi:hypothetical protein
MVRKNRRRVENTTQRYFTVRYFQSCIRFRGFGKRLLKAGPHSKGLMCLEARVYNTTIDARYRTLKPLLLLDCKFLKPLLLDCKFRLTMSSKIFQACREGDLCRVGELVKRDPSCVQETDKNGRIPLHEACQHGHLNVARFLLNIFPSGRLGKSDFDNNFPIHEACHSGNAELVRLLVSVMPKAAQSKNCFGRLPIHEAARAGQTEIVLMLREAYPPGMRAFDEESLLPLHHACQGGNVETVKCLLRGFRKGGFQIKDKDGMLPIHHACSKGSLDLIEFIFEQNPKAILIEDKHGQLPIHIARINARSSGVVLFLESHENNGEGPAEVGSGSQWLVRFQSIGNYWVAQAQAYGYACCARTRRLSLPLYHYEKKPNDNKIVYRRNLLVSGVVGSVLIIWLLVFFSTFAHRESGIVLKGNASVS